MRSQPSSKAIAQDFMPSRQVAKRTRKEVKQTSSVAVTAPYESHAAPHVRNLDNDTLELMMASILGEEEEGLSAKEVEAMLRQLPGVPEHADNGLEVVPEVAMAAKHKAAGAHVGQTAEPAGLPSDCPTEDGEPRTLPANGAVLIADVRIDKPVTYGPDGVAPADAAHVDDLLALGAYARGSTPENGRASSLDSNEGLEGSRDAEDAATSLTDDGTDDEYEAGSDADVEKDAAFWQERNPALLEAAGHAAAAWPRIIRPPRKRGGHILLDLCAAQPASRSSNCAASGSMSRRRGAKLPVSALDSRGEWESSGALVQQVVAVRDKRDGGGPSRYRLARRSRWGDLWPGHRIQVAAQ